jgi:sigma-B regulation protein RsbU (phosphoserine phosphatase)
MVDRAIIITEADRGLLLASDAEGNRAPVVARSRGGFNLPIKSLSPSETAIKHALRERRCFIQKDIELAAESVKQAASIVNQQLRSVIALPLYAHAESDSFDTTNIFSSSSLLGLLYLDSRKPAAFSGLGTQVLDALAIEAASVMDNARMMERERRQIEQNLTVAREIQQRLLPKGFKQYDFLDVSGINESCYSVGGDYFDVVELEAGRAAFVIADVSGKGLSAALLTAMLQGGFSGITLTPEPTRRVNHFNQYVWTRSEPHNYATVLLGVMDETGSAESINAHSALLLRGTEVAAPFQSDFFPVGLFPEAEFTSQSAQLKPGDTIVMFTDGINEATDVHDEEFGMDRLSEVVRSNAGESAEVLQNAFLAVVTRFCRGAQQGDDMTLLIVRYLGQS